MGEKKLGEPGTAALRAWAEQQVEAAAERAYNSYHADRIAAGCRHPTWDALCETHPASADDWRTAARAASGVDSHWSQFDAVNLMCARYILHPETPRVSRSVDAPGVRFTMQIELELKQEEEGTSERCLDQ